MGNNKSRNRNYKGKGNKFSNRNKGAEREFDSKSNASATNSPEWYIADAQLAKDVASVSFNYPVGLGIDFKDVVNIGEESVISNNLQLPGIMLLTCNPAVGLSMDATSPVNLASQLLWTKMRKEMAGAFSFDHSEVTMYILCVSQLYAMWMHGARAYSASTTYSPKSAMLPNRLMAAAGFNPADLRQNALKLRTYLNTSLAQINRFAVPIELPLFKRATYLYSKVYADSVSDKPQLYLFRPSSTWKYDQLSSETGTKCTTVSVPYLNVDNYITLMDSLIDALAQSQDALTISSYVLKAYPDGLAKLNSLSEATALEVVYDESMLMQIHNATICGYPVADASAAGGLHTINNDVEIAIDSSGNQFIKYAPMFTHIATTNGGFKHILDLKGKDDSSEAVIEATRLMVMPAASHSLMDGSSPAWRDSQNTMGLDYVTSVILMDLHSSREIRTTSLDNSSSTGTESVAMLTGVDAFDWHPTFYVFQASRQGSGPYKVNGPVDIRGEIENFALMDHATLSNIHRSALIASFIKGI